MIKPTVGRVVWYWTSALVAESDDGEPLAAIITRVWNDNLVNLCAFDSSGTPMPLTSVQLYQGEGERPGRGHAEWMPYQLGQAARTQQLEQHVAMEAAAQAERSAARSQFIDDHKDFNGDFTNTTSPPPGAEVTENSIGAGFNNQTPPPVDGTPGAEVVTEGSAPI